MFADIAVGKTGGAELFFLIAAIVFGLGGILAYSAKALWATAVAAGLCLVAIGLVLL
jgi:hypothetical protein